MGMIHESQFVPCKNNPHAINCLLTTEQRQYEREGGNPCELCGWDPKVARRRKIENEAKYGGNHIYEAMAGIADDFKAARITRENAERRLKKLCHKLLDD